MKKLTLPAFATLLFCTAFTTFKQPSKNILGKWKIDNGSLESTAKAIINLTKKLNPGAAQQIEDNLPAIVEIIEGIEITYKPDSTYEIQIPKEGTQGGKWELADNGHLLLVTPEDRPARKDSILEISAAKLRIINRERGDTTLYVRP